MLYFALLMQSQYRHLRIGLAGLGLEAYWSQFTGLEERLKGYLDQVQNKIATGSRAVVNLGLIDTPEKSLAAGHEFRRDDIEIFLYVTTYALSSTVLPVVRRAKVPVIILNLAPAAAIDYAAFNAMDDRTEMTGEWLAHCQACPVPEIANVFNRCRIPFFQVTGMLEDDPACLDRDRRMARRRRASRTSWSTTASASWATTTAACSTSTPISPSNAPTSAATSKSSKSMNSPLCATKSTTPTIKQTRARVSQVLRRPARLPRSKNSTAPRALRSRSTNWSSEHELGSLAYYYSGTGIPENEDAISSIILGTSLLTARGIPVAGEYEIKNAQAMKIMDSFGVGGSFTEYYAMDFNETWSSWATTAPATSPSPQGKTKVRPLKVYHGKVGRGLSVEMSVKHGPVTLLSVVADRRRPASSSWSRKARSVPGPSSKSATPTAATDFRSARANS